VIPSKARAINLCSKKSDEGVSTFIMDDSTEEGVFKGYVYLGKKSIPTLTNGEF
jgi:hypothetical protein